MAISFSRPDPSSPAAVAGANFGTARRGFDQQEVRDFLRMVAAELARLQERERFLERELRAAQQGAPPGDLRAIDEETATRLVGEETVRVLTTARESASQIRTKAEEGAARLLREATEEANRQREEATLEAARRRSDAAADAEAELAMAKQQGREMVEEARAYRERVLGELARRRELARQQIDQLIQGRDRLVQSFERARLVAVDIVAELAPLNEPEEYVDLTPTTGPVPLTVPSASLADASAVGDVRMPGEPAGGEGIAGFDDSAERAERDERARDDLDDDNPFVIDATDPGGVPVAVEAAPDSGATVVAFPVSPAPSTAMDEPADVDGEGDVSVDDADRSVDDDDIDGADDISDDAVADDVEALFARLRAGAPAAPAESAEHADGAEDAGDELVEASPFGRREAALVPLIVAGARKLKRCLADEQNEVLDTLRRKEPVRVIDVLLPWESEQIQRYAEAVAADLVAAAAAGAASTAGGDASEVDVDAEDVLGPSRELLGEELVTPLRERLAHCVEEGDGDNDAIAKRVRGVYREWKTQRIDEHLEDLFRTAYARAAYGAVAAGGRVRWIVDPDGPASPDCEDNSLADPVVVGDAFPTGHACPPAHPGCRCLLEVVDS